MGDPAYEAPMPAASYSNAKLFKVPLTKNDTHDVKAMVCADPHAGLMYLCNPNNPTGTTTTREDIEQALANKPQGSAIIENSQNGAYLRRTRCDSSLLRKDAETTSKARRPRQSQLPPLRAPFRSQRHR